ncbi:MAG: biopolymer transporter ExbD [Bacteroidaceae bacterium]|nr:biopolymer transporter ExbD [Bacteroidaceae bacterium]
MDFNFHRKQNKGMPGLNTTSTADISFILLIFFLMVTSMDPDKGLPRQLPKLEENKVEKITEIDKNNVLSIQLKEDGKAYINDSDQPEEEVITRIANFIVTCPQPRKHILTLEVSADASYDDYFALQNNMILAYRKVREDYAQKKYHTGYLNLNDDQQREIKKLFPQRIAEK